MSKNPLVVIPTRVHKHHSQFSWCENSRLYLHNIQYGVQEFYFAYFPKKKKKNLSSIYNCIERSHRVNNFQQVFLCVFLK